MWNMNTMATQINQTVGGAEGRLKGVKQGGGRDRGEWGRAREIGNEGPKSNMRGGQVKCVQFKKLPRVK